MRKRSRRSYKRKLGGAAKLAKAAIKRVNKLEKESLIYGWRELSTTANVGTAIGGNTVSVTNLTNLGAYNTALFDTPTNINGQEIQWRKLRVEGRIEVGNELDADTYVEVIFMKATKHWNGNAPTTIGANNDHFVTSGNHILVDPRKWKVLKRCRYDTPTLKQVIGSYMAAVSFPATKDFRFSMNFGRKRMAVLSNGNPINAVDNVYMCVFTNNSTADLEYPRIKYTARFGYLDGLS